ncbi:MAG: alpha-hydroxy-acid oxidizing protein [Burkholderiaceae bacterium]|nr:alpha-hydroxy-acid oxidizing protein [Microbacteriaceae bacterium]
MVQRRIPRYRDLAPLMNFKTPELNAKRRRLDGALTIWDLQKIAQRRTPRAAFDYTEGAAEAEISLKRARQAFEDIQFTPSILRDVSTVSTGWDVLGAPVSFPFGIAPTGFTRMMQTEGEVAGAGAAAAAGIPFSLSTMGTTSIEDVKAVNPNGRNWFQLYMWKDRDRSMALVDRAAKAGFDTLLVTVDVPVAGARLRDKRNGFSIPPQLTAGTVLNALPRPEWWINFLTTEPLAFASLDRWSGTVGELLDTMFDPTVTFEDLAWIKAQWPGKVVVKGVQNLDDARKLATMGIDGITLSNHGGRQLDRAPIPFHLLPDVAREVGSDMEVHLDTGIMSGADIVASIALGARFTMIGRAYLYGLMAGGREGVDRTISILSEQIIRTMRLLGVTSLEELTPAHVVQLERLVPRAVSPSAVAAAEPAAARPRARKAAAKVAADVTATVIETTTAKAAAPQNTAPKTPAAKTPTTRAPRTAPAAKV